MERILGGEEGRAGGLKWVLESQKRKGIAREAILGLQSHISSSTPSSLNFSSLCLFLKLFLFFYFLHFYCLNLKSIKLSFNKDFILI